MWPFILISMNIFPINYVTSIQERSFSIDFSHHQPKKNPNWRMGIKKDLQPDKKFDFVLNKFYKNWFG